MKKIIAALLVLCLTACTAAQKQESLPREFDAAVQISSDGTIYTAVYEKRIEYDKLIFSDPEHLAGLEITLKDGVAQAKIGDLTVSSAAFGGMFDFLPVTQDETKSIGSREFKIEIQRSME